MRSLSKVFVFWTEHTAKYGPICAPKKGTVTKSSPPPGGSMAPNPCNLAVCKEQLCVAYDKIKEINHIVRTLTADIEQARVCAEQHKHHVKYLVECMFEMGGTSVDKSKLQDFILEAGEHLVFEVPDNLSTISSELSVGHKLTEQSLSSNGAFFYNNIQSFHIFIIVIPFL